MTDDAHIRKEQVAGLYSRVAPTYGRVGPDVFAPFGRWLVARTNLSPGERVLDVATGRGAALFAAAEQVGAACCPGAVQNRSLRASGLLEATRWAAFSEKSRLGGGNETTR